ncbi:MAG: hypothetical protein H0W75_08375 [Chitinophagaceae bacterium]|nr:hypothetical protein [Chitinophagaceae bacterium]
MDLKKLLLFHAIVTLAAGIVLVVAPSLIPQTVNIKIAPNEYLLCYFLGAAEFGIAYLSFFSRTIRDKSALRIISITFIVFHATTGVLELYSLLQGMTSKIIGNIFLRIIIVVLFYYYGVYQNKEKIVE